VTTQTRSNGSGAGTGETERADHLMADAEDRVGEWGERVGRWASRAAAHAREETEDIWAEAQTIRRGQ
jgi:hypothetical protein